MLQNTSTKTINLVIAIISVAVPSLVIAMLKFAPPAITHNIDLSFFPKFHAFVNTGTTLCLLTGLFFIKNSKFGGEGVLRYAYFFILISHIILSAIVLPFVLKTFSFAFKNDFIQHKKWAKFTYPLWLYVAITGVLVYVFMAPYY